MRRGQQMVLAEAGESALPDLFETLNASQTLVRASWFALLDGEPQAVAIAFDGPDAADSALDLMTELRAAAHEARRTAVSGVGSIEELSRRSKQRAQMARRHQIRVNRERPEDGDACSMGDPGFEPGTSSLSEKRSNRLS